MTTVTDRVKEAQQAHGWTAEEQQSWTYDPTYRTIRPGIRIADPERFKALLIPIAEVLPEGTRVRDEDAIEAVFSRDYLRDAAGVGLVHASSFLNPQCGDRPADTLEIV